jgi:hypothetical protein
MTVVDGACRADDRSPGSQGTGPRIVEVYHVEKMHWIGNGVVGGFHGIWLSLPQGLHDTDGC